MLGQSPAFIAEFFVDPKNGTLKTNKPPAIQSRTQICGELERLRRENLRLKRQLEEKDMVVELLKQ